jgi:spermidine synthase
MQQTAATPVTQQQFVLLSGSIFIIAACSLVYELLISSLSTYLLGSSVVHYSITIGLFLFFMGVGAWLAQSIRQALIPAFVGIEIAIGAVGGVSALVLYAAYVWSDFYYPVMLIVTGVIGILVGMELPLLTRILESHSGLRRGISQVLTFDYLGALAASLLFPFILLPYFGHLVTASIIGVVNLLVALLVAWTFRHQLQQYSAIVGLAAAASAALVLLAAAWANPAAEIFENALYEDPVMHTEQSRYQKLVVTQRGDDLRLYLDGNLQFSSLDEYRYHEVLVHLPAAFVQRLKRVLVIGGGDGLAVREVLQYPSVESVTLVDLDPAVTTLARAHAQLQRLNHNALAHPAVTVVNADAWQWLAQQGDLFDLVIVDLPDPENEATARLYSVAFYQRVARRLSVGGAMVTQATSPWFSRRAFWSIGATLSDVFTHVRPATVYVPSFGLWGFFIAADHALKQPARTPFNGSFFSAQSLPQVLTLPDDLPPLQVEINRSQSLPILEYYREGWQSLNHGIAADGASHDQ